MLVRCTSLLSSSAFRVPRLAVAKSCAIALICEARGHQNKLPTPAQSLPTPLQPCRTDTLSRRSLSTVAASSVTQQRRKLFLYSKEGCHLCDGLKEKIQALLDRAQFMPSALSDVDFEIRDITTEPAWWEAYSLTIPVLTFADADGSNEVKVPRPSPRMSTDRLGQHLEKALESNEQEP